jgi:hypothetical protein
MGLVNHARCELQRVGLFDKDSDYDGMLGDAVIELMERFAGQGHSGFSAMRTLELFYRLAQFKPLGPITNDCNEWSNVTEFGNRKLWQSRRRPDLFSYDQGKTYYSVDEHRLPAWVRSYTPGFLWSTMRWIDIKKHKSTRVDQSNKTANN